jgi:hypothetical protein
MPGGSPLEQNPDKVDSKREHTKLEPRTSKEFCPLHDGDLVLIESKVPRTLGT